MRRRHDRDSSPGIAGAPHIVPTDCFPRSGDWAVFKTAASDRSPLPDARCGERKTRRIFQPADLFDKIGENATRFVLEP
jgi:hypothetical protein